MVCLSFAFALGGWYHRGDKWIGDVVGKETMSYYLYMALLVVTLVLWAIIALRDDDAGGNR
jgi:hypothetical protein